LKINFYTGTLDHQNIVSSGGVQFVLSKICSALCNEGVEINIISSFKGDSPCPFSLHGEIKHSYIQVTNRHNSDSPFYSRLWFWIVIFFKIKKILRQPGVDYHISVSPALSIIIIIYSFTLKIKVIIWENVQFHVYNRFINLIRLFLFKYASFVVVVSNPDYLYFQKYGVNARLIYNPGSLESCSNSQQFSHSNPSGNLVAAGRLTCQKGFDMLIDIANILKEKYTTDFKITIVGDGPLKDDLIKKVKSLKLESFIFFQGFTRDINRIYQTNSIFLLPSRFEGLPIVLLDSQAHGLPCIAFNCPTGPAEVIENNINGFLINCFDLEDFASKINALILDRDLLNSLSANAVSRSKSFCIKDISEKWINLIQHVK
jgi:glycosyltransferase involved in cell wall biosynthesis